MSEQQDDGACITPYTWEAATPGQLAGDDCAGCGRSEDDLWKWMRENPEAAQYEENPFGTHRLHFCNHSCYHVWVRMMLDELLELRYMYGGLCR